MLVDSESWHISFSMCKRIQEDIRIIFVSMMETVQEWFVNEKKLKYIQLNSIQFIDQLYYNEEQKVICIRN